MRVDTCQKYTIADSLRAITPRGISPSYYEAALIFLDANKYIKRKVLDRNYFGIMYDSKTDSTLISEKKKKYCKH